MDRKKYRKSGNSADRKKADRVTGKNQRISQKRKIYRKKRGKNGRRFSTGTKVAIAIAGILVILIASLLIYASTKLQKLNTKKIRKEDIVMNDLAKGVGDGFTNIAFFGGDSRIGELVGDVRSDSIIIASLNNKTREVRMVSVYRDTLLDVSQGSYEKCNSAYSLGGPKQALDMLNMNLDLDITEYVTVDFAAVSDVIDLLGGLDIEINEAEIAPLNKYVKETAKVAGKKGIKINKAGVQHLDGVQATTYARIRSTKGGDFRRAERQRYVIEKIVEKVMKSDLKTINKIIDAVLPKIQTSLSPAEILDYAKTFNKYKLGKNIGFPMDKTTDTIPSKGSVVIPITLETNVVKLHEFLYGDESYEPSEKVRAISENILYITGKTIADPEMEWQRPADMKPQEQTNQMEQMNQTEQTNQTEQ